ncbi:MAG TPA: DUF6232 family protein [Micromonosporaceae bacterium]|jgi:hypothetical protein|nr:DUF6232 family protein [Micromonosporaceae bacterium]
MALYYRGPCARITDELFEVWCPHYRAFPVRELRNVRVVRGGSDPIAVRSTSLAGAAAAAFAVSWPFLENPTAWLIAAGLVATSAAASGACWRTRPRTYELWATVRTMQVLLFRSRDAQAFGQLRRGLTRAIERTGGV